MINTYKPLLLRALKNVPSYLRDDCFQAACLGLTMALKKKDEVTFFKSYAYQCIKHEVSNELATLSEPIPINRNAFNLLCKYKNSIRAGEEPEINASDDVLSALDKLMRAKRYSYMEYRQDDWE